MKTLEVTIPKTCGECKFIGRYQHCYCDLLSQIVDTPCKVKEHSLDVACPLTTLEYVLKRKENAK